MRRAAMQHAFSRVASVHHGWRGARPLGWRVGSNRTHMARVGTCVARRVAATSGRAPATKGSGVGLGVRRRYGGARGGGGGSGGDKAHARWWAVLSRACVAVSTSMAIGDATCQYVVARGLPSDSETREAEANAAGATGDDGQPRDAAAVDTQHWWDWHRTAQMAAAGLLATGPLSVGWQHVLEYLVPGRSVPQVLRKMALNAAVAPISVSITFTTVTLFRGGSLQDARSKVSNDVVDTVLVGAMYWPLISFMNFRFTPVALRPVTMAIAASIWNGASESSGCMVPFAVPNELLVSFFSSVDAVYLSYMTFRSRDESNIRGSDAALS